MDGLQALGRDIPSIIGPTYQIYGHLLRQEDNAKAIHSTVRQEHTYGPDQRQKLDHYRPRGVNNNHDAREVLMFVYGGGFISGDKVLKEIPDQVAYTNVGHFFADKVGIDTVLIDYRLIGHGAKYPSGAEDVDLALSWIEKTFPNCRSLYLLGNSAGGVHVASWLFGAHFSEHRNRLVAGRSESDQIGIEAVGFLGAPLELNPEGAMKPLLHAYYGEPDLVRAEQPQKLMLDITKGLSPEAVALWPRLAVLVCELDPEEEIRNAGRRFFELWQCRGGMGELVDLPSHNHISPVLSLGTAIEREESWGRAFGQWLRFRGAP
jgi:acetyl esterase/lipase